MYFLFYLLLPLSCLLKAFPVIHPIGRGGENFIKNLTYVFGFGNRTMMPFCLGYSSSTDLAKYLGSHGVHGHERFRN